MNYQDYTYKKTPRQMAHSPKTKAITWCFGCDRCLVGYKKCPVCGKRNLPFRLKKEPI